MFNPNDYDLNQEYRNRKTNRAEKARFAQFAQTVQQPTDVRFDEPAPPPSAFDWELSSQFAFRVATAAVMIVIFFAGVMVSSAQNEDFFSPGHDNGAVAYTYLSGAVISVQEGNYEHAIAYLHATIEESPEFAAGYIGYSYVALYLEYPEIALEAAMMAFDLTPDDPAAHFVMAEAYFALENYTDAEIFYSSYLQLVEENEDEQPVLIMQLLNVEDSLPMVNEHLAACQEQLIAS